MSVRRRHIKKYIPLFLTVFTGTLLTAIITNWHSEFQRKEQDARFQKQIDQATLNLQRNFDRYTDSLFSIGDYFVSVSSKVNPNQFSISTDRVINLNSGIRALEWVPEVTRKNRKAFELAVKNEGFKEFQITERQDGKFVRASDRPFHYPIQYVNPYVINKKAGSAFM